ncbi:transporter [Cnuibacter physcomitrellae]|uniref:EamA family transporter n=1 Tax=Cnuibacter physcomitrellae TaxID=1619308 RepID=A0A1X9LKL9_9MICO|nr:EamA family transporter [Cnuibacter physcomitrellae]ARJ05667.1 EamA family transporter [Cnuibacter physcomitrellae]GGI36214.1 transporter [Cnuibacter physcomitrellae]
MRPVLAVLLAAVCFGTTGSARALADVEAGALSVGAARILIGGGLLALVAWLLSRRRSAEPAAAPRGGARRGMPTPLVIALGAAGVVAYQPLFFLGTETNGVAIGTIVALGSAPVLTGVADWALSRRFPGWIWVVATAVATIGVVLLSGITAGSTGSVSGIGLLASLGAGASYAAYTLAGKALLDRGWSSTSTMGVLFGWAAAASLPLLLLSGPSWLVTPEGALLALWLGIVTTTVAYVLFGWGLARLSPATVSTLTLAEPLTATLLGLLVLGETLDATATAGLVVLALGILVLAIPRRRSVSATA